MRVCVVGTGYVGLVSGACLATFGHTVCCVDTDAARLAQLAAGQAPFHEPGLQALLAQGLERLRFSPHAAEAAADAEVVIVAVGTPLAHDGVGTDLSQLLAAVQAVAPALPASAVLVLKSTSPVGTGDAVATLLRELRPEADIAVACNPEFLREGHAISDFCHPDRIVFGTDSAHAEAVLRRLHAAQLQAGVPVVATTRRTAELVKYAANAFLATKLAFINEIADLCECLDTQVEDVALGIGLDPRIGAQYLRPGPGYGGSCLPKDLVALAGTARAHGMPLAIVEAVAQLNEDRKVRMQRKITEACGGDVRSRAIALLGAAFKPDTDDVRASPALSLAAALLAAGATVRLSDPKALERARTVLPGAAFFADPVECAAGCDAVVIATEWPVYAQLDLHRLRAGMRGAVLIDLRNLHAPAAARAAGFTYVGLGRGKGGLGETATLTRTP
ncbi:UDP-glucose 6-dehydrogenase [Variovorax sp. Root411]|nr:UDP-glucose 6-dehydrogenase [Variovorax sp. Root411]